MVAHLDAVTSLAVDPNGLYLMSGSEYPSSCTRSVSVAPDLQPTCLHPPQEPFKLKSQLDGFYFSENSEKLFS